MRAPTVIQYLFPVEVRDIHVSLVMYGGSASGYDMRRRGGRQWGPPHVVVLYPSTAPEIRLGLGSTLVDRELSQSAIETAITLGQILLIDLETLHRLATELASISALPESVETAMMIAGPEIAKHSLSIIHDVTSKLLALGNAALPVCEGDALIERAIAAHSVSMDAALVFYCRSFLDFLDSLLFPGQDRGVGWDSDVYAVSIFLTPRLEKP